jgi:gag-polypeptide of LTR copia-type/Zinc knuckle
MFKINLLNKLKGEDDYILWKSKLKNYFKANDFQDALTGVPQDAEKAAEWRKAQVTYVAQVMLSIDDAIYHRVPENKQGSVNEVLEVLDAEFKRKGEAAYQATYSKLVNLKQKSCSSLQDYLNRMTELFEKCAIFDKPVDEHLKVALMMGGLSAEYKPICQSLQACATSLEKPTSVETLKQALLSSTNEPDESETSNALTAKRGSGNFRGRGKGRGRGGSRQNHHQKNDSDGKEKDKPSVKCWNCQKFGHKKKDCRSEKKEEEATTSVSYETFLSEAHVTDNRECFKVASNESQVSDDYVWLLDSGASTHMTKNKKFFTTLSNDAGGEVIVANSARIKIEGSGTIMVKFEGRNFKL